jgi:hypothetical protein
MKIKHTYISQYEEMRVLKEVAQLMDQGNEKLLMVSEHDMMTMVDPYLCNNIE